MIDREVSDRRGVRKPQVHGDAPAAVRIDLDAAPADDAAARSAEADLEGGAAAVFARVGGARSRNPDPFALVVVDPEHPVAATERAVAGRDGVGHAVEGPTEITAVTASGEHDQVPFVTRWDPRRLPKTLDSRALMTTIRQCSVSKSGRSRRWKPKLAVTIKVARISAMIRDVSFHPAGTEREPAATRN
jgi:hypothetical protein